MMGRANNQAASKNKHTLPQTPKNLKIEPENVNDEFSLELAEHRVIKAKQDE
jgi:hypothetical protein